MPLPELWFVYDSTEQDFDTFLSEVEARAEYDRRIRGINDEVGGDEYDGGEAVYVGKVHARAEVVPVALDEETGDELWSLVSYGMKVCEG
jgi:hypothetical protein